MLEEVHTHGLTWNFLSYVGDSRGVEMSLVMNSNYAFSGAQAAVMGNRAVDGKDSRSVRSTRVWIATGSFNLGYSTGLTGGYFLWSISILGLGSLTGARTGRQLKQWAPVAKPMNEKVGMKPARKWNS